MKDVHNYYIENINNMIDVAENTEDGGNQFVARIAAKELTEKQLLVDEFNRVAKEKELELQTYQPNNKERLEEINKYKLAAPSNSKLKILIKAALSTNGSSSLIFNSIINTLC